MRKLKYWQFSIVVTVIVYILTYSIVSFVIWKLYNPFYRIINISVFDGWARFGFLLMYVVYHLMLYGIYTEVRVYKPNTIEYYKALLGAIELAHPYKYSDIKKSFDNSRVETLDKK